MVAGQEQSQPAGVRIADELDSSWGMTASLDCTCRPIAKCRLAADDAPDLAAYRR
jgi:hypothetical protein